jgi:hypothetical protein
VVQKSGTNVGKGLTRPGVCRWPLTAQNLPLLERSTNAQDCPRPWKNASAEDGGSTSIVQVMAGVALIQDLRPGLLAVTVQHR